MRLDNLNSLRVLKEVTNQIKSRPELRSFLWRWVDGDDRVIFMLATWFSAQRHPSSGRSVPTVLHCKTGDEERSRVDGEVRHWVAGARVGGAGGGGRRSAAIGVFSYCWGRWRILGEICLLVNSRR